MLLSYTLLAASLVTAITITRPNGTYAVQNTVKEVVDHSRTYQGKPWRIMTTIFYPVGRYSDCNPYLEPYMPLLTAEINAETFSREYGFLIPNSTFNSLQLQTCNVTSYGERNQSHEWPLTFFSSGFGGPRQLYSALAEELAARGYVVVTMDDPDQTAIIEYTDGSYVTQTTLILNTTTQDLSHLANRTADIFLVKEKALTGALLPAHLHVNKSRMAVWGHSFGGAAAAQVMAEDPSFAAGINYNGDMYGSVVASGLSKPFQLWTQPTLSNLVGWAEFLNASTGSNILELNLDNATHSTFSDLPLIAGLTGFSAVEGVEAIIGSLDGRRVLAVLADYADAFFRYGFGEGKARILEGPSVAFPEVGFERYL